MMKKILVFQLLLLPLWACFSPARAQPPHSNPVTARRVDPLRTYWEDQDQFLERQGQAGLDLVQELLRRFPPSLEEPLERQAAMLLLDTVLHEEKAPHRRAVQEFFHQRMADLSNDLQATEPDSGAVIWKLYDHGFIIRTPSVTLLFDFTRGYSSGARSFAIADETASRIIGQCDVLFITHIHEDHADPWVAERFLALGKPVVTPRDLFREEIFHSRITNLERSAEKVQELNLPGNTRLEVRVYPGHQGSDLDNNVYLVQTPEGFTFLHTGDQSNEDDFAWIDGISRSSRVDILFPNCWSTDIARMIRGVAPKLVITGHENELGHSVVHREPNWLTYDRLQGTVPPVVLMAWGERFRYSPE